MSQVQIPYRPIPADALVVADPVDGVHPQEAFHRDRGKVFHRAALCGTGAGKTAAGSFESLACALKYPGTAWGAYEPTYPMVQSIMLPAFRKLLGGPIQDSPLVRRYSETDHFIEFLNGSILRFGSLERPERAEGPNLDGAWVDEPRLVRKWMGDDGAFLVLDRRLRGTGAHHDCPVGMWLTTSAPHRYIHEQWERRDSKHYLPNSRVYRWSTLDNPHTPERYRETQARQHVGTAHDRFILGQYGTAEGLLLEGFDPARHVQRRREEWTKTTGGVDWGWTDPAAVILVHWLGGEKYHVEERLYGSNIKKEAIKDLVRQIDKELDGIHWRAGHDEPEAIKELQGDHVRIEKAGGRGSVSERMTYLQEAAHRGWLTADPGAVNFVSEAEGLEEDPKKPGYPLPGPDHACLVAGTRVWTKRGDVLIEDVRRSDYVMTRQGWRAVQWSGCTQRDAELVTATFEDGRILTGTPVHPVATPDGLWMPLGMLSKGDYTWAYTASQKKSNTVAQPTAATPKARSRTSETTSVDENNQGHKNQHSYIAGSGKTIMVPSLKAAMSTTRMEIPPTTTPTTWSCSPKKNTSKSMREKPPVEAKASDSRPTSNLSGTRPPRGTAAKRAVHGIASTPAAWPPYARPAPSRAKSADKRTMPSQLEPTAIAAPLVLKRRVGASEWTTSRAPAKYVDRGSRPTNPGQRRLAGGSALGVSDVRRAGKGDVYNLKVEGEPEFFANGILVHNCDAASYAVMAGKAPKAPEPRIRDLGVELGL